MMDVRPSATDGCLARLVVGDSEGAPSGSQATDSGGRVSNFRIMAVRRGFSSEGDLLLDYLEKGVFHALEKQYLKSFVLALYLVRRFLVLLPRGSTPFRRSFAFG
jgi:HORMA domain